MTFHKCLFVIILSSVFFLSACTTKTLADTQNTDSPLPKALVYTRNHVSSGKGFVHDNIKSSVEAIQKMGKENGFSVDVSDNPNVFTKENLKKYKAVIFSNANNEAFENDEQRNVFQEYIRSGGGFVGIHSATGSERKWPWYWQLIGGTFAWHLPRQDFMIKIVDTNHPSTSFVKETRFLWKDDEFYYVKERNTNVTVLVVGETTSMKKPPKLPAGTLEPNPLSWYQNFEGGRSFYTALGHQKAHYKDPFLTQHILGGILWAMGIEKKTAAIRRRTSAMADTVGQAEAMQSKK
jgi:uncharacterized protein